MKSAKYLGAGLYADFDEWMITLRVQRGNEQHFICLDEDIVKSFLDYVEECFDVKIAVERDQLRAAYKKLATLKEGDPEWKETNKRIDELSRERSFS